MLNGAYPVVVKLAPLGTAIDICFIMSCVGGFAVAMENEGNKLVATRLNFHSERNSYDIIILQNPTFVQMAL